MQDPVGRMLPKLAKGLVAIALGLALGAAIVVGISSLLGVTWFGGNTEVDGWYVSAENASDPFVLARGTEGLSLDLNVSRADVGGGHGYTGPLGFSGRYSNRIPAERPFELRFVAYGNVSNMTAGFTMPWYFDAPGEAPPQPGESVQVGCDVKAPTYGTKTYGEGQIVVNVTGRTCSFIVNLSEPLDLPPEDGGGTEIRLGTTWLSDAGMRFQARWLESR